MISNNKGQIVSISISPKRGTKKEPVDLVSLDKGGIIGDGHYGFGHRQVSILSMENLEIFSREKKREFQAGEFAENLRIDGIDFSRMTILDRIKIGENVILEFTQKGKKCHGDDCPIYREIGECLMPDVGIFCRVLKGGKIKIGDEVKALLRPLQSKIITISDRAYNKIYNDRSGPAIREILVDYFMDKEWHSEIYNIIVPDDEDRIKREIQTAVDTGIDLIITTGGTGPGKNDITPDIIEPILEKPIPGIMEFIRCKYGKDNPNALLSRGIAGVINKSQIYTLPGSVKAVGEYMREITKTLEHILLLLHGIDPH